MSNDTRAGAALIGTVLQEPGLAHDIAEVVQSAQFGDWRQSAIFAAIERVLSEGQLPTLARINNSLRVEQLDAIGDEEGQKYATPYTRKTALDAAEYVAEQGRRRQLLQQTKQLLGSLEGGTDIGSTELAERLVANCVDVVTRGSVKHHDIAELGQQVYERGKARYEGTESVQRFKAGIPKIDELVRVVPRYTKVIFAASGGGKTSFAFWQAVQFAAANPKMGVLFCSLADMDAHAIGARALSLFSNVSSTFTLFERPDESELGQMASGVTEMERFRNRFKVVEPGQLIESCVMHARRAHLAMARKGIKLGMVVIDYAQRAEVRQKGLSDLHILRQVSKICLLQIARPLDCEVVINSQMNRNQQADSRGKAKRRAPQTSDIAGGSDLERDAHCIIAMEKIGRPKNTQADQHGRRVDPPPEVLRVELHRMYVLKNRFMPNHRHLDLHADLATNRYYVPGDFRSPVTRWVENKAQLTVPLNTQPRTPSQWGQP